MCIPIFGQFNHLHVLERVRSAFTGQCKNQNEVGTVIVHGPKMSSQHRGHTTLRAFFPAYVEVSSATLVVLIIQSVTFFQKGGHLRPFPGTGSLAISSSVIG